MKKKKKKTFNKTVLHKSLGQRSLENNENGHNNV